MDFANLHRTTWNFFSGAQYSYGPGAVGLLTPLVDRQSARRVLVVSDRGLESAGLVAQVLEALSRTTAVTHSFLDGEVEPSTETVSKLVQVASEFNPDFWVALGGGSNMDLCKVAAVVHSHGVDPESLFGHDQVPGAIQPIVCLPTTAGTGSEVTHSAVIKSSSSGKKGAILSQNLRPPIAIVDPQLSLGCPATVTAASGMDALTHAIEAYLVTNFYAMEDDFEHGLAFEGNHPLGDLFAEKAISLIGGNLQTVVEQPDQLAARSSMAFAASLAGWAFSSCGVSITHALEYPIGARYECSHGAGNGIVLPAVMRFWLPARTQRLARIAKLLGIDGAERMETNQAAEAAVKWVESIRPTIGLPTGLAEVGAQEEDCESLAQVAASIGRLVDLSPRPFNQQDAKQLLLSSLESKTD